MTPVPGRATVGRVRSELFIVLAVTFGMSGVRALLKLVDALLDPAPLNEQSVTLNASQSSLAWLDIALQLCSAGVLVAWGALALYLLAGEGIRPARPGWRDAGWGAALAAGIGLPGLAWYAGALHWGWTKEVIPTAFTNAWVEAPSLLAWSFANAFGEEIVVVCWLIYRLRAPRERGGLGWSLTAALGASALLRASYHLYQGVSAGLGNLAMGLVFGYFYYRTGRIWPLVIAHFLIDAVAFVGYGLLFGA